jgi:hypothetical protein
VAFRVSTSNLLSTWTASSSPTQSSGYTASDAYNGNPGVIARTQTAGSGTYIFDRGASFATTTYVGAAFGLTSKDEGVDNVDSVTIYDNSAATAIGATSLTTISLDSRGDGWASFTSTQRYLLWTVTLTTNDEIDFGEIWVGTYTDLARPPASPLSRSVDYATLVNDAVDGSVFTARVSDYLESLSFRWGSLTTTQANEVLTVYHAAKGRLNPVVIVPDTTSTEVFHGHFQADSLPREVDAPVVRGLSLDLRQTGRVLYG